MKQRTLIIGFIAMIAAGALTPAQAREFRFDFRAYELETAGGRAALIKRLDNAAKSYCGVRHATGIQQTQVSKICLVTVMDEVVRQIDDARITALYEDTRLYAGTPSK